MDLPYSPRPARLLVGFVVAPLLASAAPFAVMQFAEFIRAPGEFLRHGHESIVGDALFIAFVGAYPMTFFIGLPLFFLLMAVTPWIGFGPVAPIAVGWTTAFAGTVLLQALDHHVSTEGYVLAAETGLDGAFGGFLFWLIAVGLDPRWRARRAQPAPSAQAPEG